MNEVLQVKNLNYKALFKDLNLTIYENTINLITGSNNCGKTTFIKILSGLIDTEKSVFYQKKDISKLKSKELATTFSQVIFTNNFNFHFLNLDQEILFYLDKTDLSVSEKKMKYRHLVKLFDLEMFLYEDINRLDYYTKIKILVLFATISSPKILFLDNVLDNLEEKEGLEIINTLKKIGGMTVIISSSSLNLALSCDYIHVLSKSSFVLSDTTMEVLKEDSLLNKIGLTLPFMVDLSLKLKYYDLIDDVELDMNRMVDKLWK